jgi:hypothetical protein
MLCFLDDLDFVNQSIQRMGGYKPRRVEFRRLVHIAEQLVRSEQHQQREEEILVPELENRGVFVPSMFIHEEHLRLREYENKLLELASSVPRMDFKDFAEQLDEIVRFIVPTLRDHIFKENNMLYPTALETIDDKKVWLKLKEDCDRVGYCCFISGD